MRAGELAPLLRYGAALGLGLLSAAASCLGARRIPRALAIPGAPASKLRDDLLQAGVAVAIAVAIVELVARTLPGDADASSLATKACVHVALVTIVLTAARIDLQTMILPDALTLGGALVALVTSPLRGVGVLGALAGAAVGLAIGLGPALLYRRLRGRVGLGLGDAKLTILAGAWLGPLGAVFVLFAGMAQLSLTSLALHAIGVRVPVPASVVAQIAEVRAAALAGDEDAQAALDADPMAQGVGEGVGEGRLPLGPFLALACVEFLFVGPPIVRAVFG